MSYIVILQSKARNRSSKHITFSVYCYTSFLSVCLRCFTSIVSVWQKCHLMPAAAHLTPALLSDGTSVA